MQGLPGVCLETARLLDALYRESDLALGRYDGPGLWMQGRRAIVALYGASLLVLAVVLALIGIAFFVVLITGAAVARGVACRRPHRFVAPTTIRILRSRDSRRRASLPWPVPQ